MPPPGPSSRALLGWSQGPKMRARNLLARPPGPNRIVLPSHAARILLDAGLPLMRGVVFIDERSGQKRFLQRGDLLSLFQGAMF